MNEFASEKLFREGVLLNPKESAEMDNGKPTGRTRIFLEVAWMGGKYARIQADTQKFELIKENGQSLLRHLSSGKTFEPGKVYYFTLESSPREVSVFKEQKAYVSVPHTLFALDTLPSATAAPAAKSYAMNPTEEKKK